MSSPSASTASGCPSTTPWRPSPAPRPRSCSPASGPRPARIRLGSGGIMLPHYTPLKVAETFRTLHALYPNRIDLGIGRAPGGGPVEATALRRYRGAPRNRPSGRRLPRPALRAPRLPPPRLPPSSTPSPKVLVSPDAARRHPTSGSSAPASGAAERRSPVRPALRLRPLLLPRAHPPGHRAL